MTSRRSVPDDGRLDAPLVIVGEAPSTQELARRKPFVGPSGGKLTEWWKRPEINLHRKDIYITNVLPYMVQKIPRGGVHGLKITVAEWNEAVTNLHRRLAQLSQPTLIVAVGDIALLALRGHGGILKWRGSCLVYEPLQRRLLGTVHPAALFRDPSLERRCIADWQKIARELRTPSTLPKRRHHIAPSFAEVQAFVREVDAAGKAGILAIDIETPVKMKTVKALTPKGRPTTKKVRGKPFIGCVGFALSPTESITIPTQRAYWKQYGVDLADVWEAIRQLCASPTQKVLQNGFFDTFYLLREQGITLRNWRWDTLAMHHVIDASEEHSLAYLASIYTNEPYWKDEGKTAGDLRGMPNDLEQWWRYNGKDACVTRELVDALRAELAKLPDGHAFYRDHYRKCFQPILGMMADGICVDEERRITRHAELVAKAERLKRKINTAAGMDLLGKTSLSSTKLRAFLYDTLKLPKQFAKNARKEKVVSAGEIQLRRLMLKYPTHEQLQKVGRLVLKYRRTHKLSTFFQDKLVDADGRVRCTYTFETDTGRLSSRQNPMGGGMNLQNVDREARDVFIADPGGIFVEGDLSQAESRIVYTLTGDPELIEVAQRMPWEYDSHTENTARILGIAMDEVTKEDRRNIGKPTAHACVDAETEVLTPDGWLRIDEVNGQAVACWDATTRTTSFHVPSAHHVYDAPPTMLLLAGRGINQCVTSNHRVPYASFDEIKVQSALRVSMMADPRIPTSGWFSGTVHNPHWLRLVAAIQADGSIRYGDHVQFHFKKPRKIRRIKQLLDAYGCAWRESSHADGSTSIRATILGAREAKFFGAWLLHYDGESLDAFLDELKHWDGSSVTRHHHKRESYYSSVRDNVDWAQTIAHLRGRRGTIRKSTRCWHLSLAQRQFARTHFEAVPNPSAKVYCLTVPTSYFFVRRHGTISVTGNSHYGQMGPTMSDTMLKHGVVMTPEECQGHINAYLTWRHQIPKWHQSIKWTVIDQRRLVNSWGRVADFRYMRLVPHLYQKAFNFLPQSEVAGIINQYGMIPIYKAIRTEGMHHRLRLQTHDSLTYWSPLHVEDVWWIIQTMRHYLERPRPYNGTELTIPVEFKIGTNWGQMIEFKKPPTKHDVRRALEELREA